MEPTEPTMDYGGYGGGNPKSSMFERLKGVVLFRPPMYREIAKDEDAIGTAAIIVIAVALMTGFISGLLLPSTLNSPQYQQIFAEFNMNMSPLLAISGLVWGGVMAIIYVIVLLLIWVLFSWLSALIANKFFEGQTKTIELMRIYGFASIYGVLSVIPCLGIIAAIVLPAITNVIGVKEAAAIDTGNAVFTWLIATVITVIIVGLAYCCISLGLGFLIGLTMQP
jgi:hypothetical protein